MWYLWLTIYDKVFELALRDAKRSETEHWLTKAGKLFNSSMICTCLDFRQFRDRRVWQFFPSPYFFPNHPLATHPPLPHTPTLPPILPLREKSGPRRRQDGGYILLLKYVNENIVSRAKKGLLCIFVDDHNTFLNIWINKLFEKWRF